MTAETTINLEMSRLQAELMADVLTAFVLNSQNIELDNTVWTPDELRSLTDLTEQLGKKLITTRQGLIEDLYAESLAHNLEAMHRKIGDPVPDDEPAQPPVSNNRPHPEHA